MYFLLFYDVIDNYVERRAPYRDQHLTYAEASRDRGELTLAGATGTPPNGAVLLFKGDDAAVAENFAKGDPYVKAGLITQWRVVPWHVVVGEGAIPR